MKHTMSKLFGKYENGKTIVASFVYDDSKTDYYTFVKVCRGKGYHQIILTSDIILSMLSFYFINKKMNISEIKFFEDDENIQDEIDVLLAECKQDRAFFSKLKEELSFLFDNESIEIKSIEMIGNYNYKGEDMPKSIFFKANGIIGIDKYVHDKEICVVKNFVEDEINE